MNIQKLIGDSTNEISIIKNPFSKNMITDIDLSMTTLYSGTKYFSASVSFKNGNTVGKQKFEGSSMDDLIIQVRDFIKTLD